MPTGSKKGQKIAKPKVERRGGTRPGAGRPAKPKNYLMTNYQIKKMILTARGIAKKRRKTLDAVLIEMAYDAESDRDKLAAIKVYKDLVMGKRSTVTSKSVAPVQERSKMGLPPRKPDPAKLNIFKGGKPTG